MEGCELLKGKIIEEEDSIKIILAVMQLSETEMSEGTEQIVPSSGSFMKNVCDLGLQVCATHW